MASPGVTTTIEVASCASGSTFSTDPVALKSDGPRIPGASAAIGKEVRGDEAGADSTLSSTCPSGDWRKSRNEQEQGDAPVNGRDSNRGGGVKAVSGVTYDQAVRGGGARLNSFPAL